MTLNLKLKGLKLDQQLSFPKAGTLSARIIECLEAEPATVVEIVAYLDSTTEQVAPLVQKLRGRGLIRHRGEFQYELVDPEAASLAYAEE